MPKVHIPRAYRQYTADVASYNSNNTNLTILLEELICAYPSLIGTVFSADGKLFPFVRIVVQDNMIDIENYISKTLSLDDDVWLINAVAGG